MTAPKRKAPAPQQREPLPEVTDKMRATAADILRKAKVQLAINHPFFGQIVLNRKIAVVDEVPTAYITNGGYITIGTRFLAHISVQQCVFLLAHEAMHYAMLHGLRLGARKPGKWNVACDAVINDILQNAKVGEFIPEIPAQAGGGTSVNMPGSKDKTSEKVYEELPDNNGGGGGGYQPGSGTDDMKQDGKMDQSTAREIEEKVRVELAQATAVAKQQGKLPAGIESFVDAIVNPITPWHQLLERYMTSMIKEGISWRRPNRRYINGGLYLPTQDQVPKMGPVVIARDTSGSCMDPASQVHFLGHINAILERCRPEVVYVIDCDAAVHQVIELTMEDLPITPCKKMATKGGGGTSFRPPFEYVREQGLEPEVFIYLTDMYGDFPEAPPYPTVWLSTTDVKEAPFGDVIQYRVE